MKLEDHEAYLRITEEYAIFSKCQFTKVGAIAINERSRIIATGVNGTLPGHENCCDHVFEKREDHVQFTKENELHAEINLILDIAKSSTKFSELSIYLTISPCEECLKALLGLTDNTKGNTIRVVRIVYGEKYHRTTEDELERMKKRASFTGTELISINQLRKESEQTIS